MSKVHEAYEESEMAAFIVIVVIVILLLVRRAFLQNLTFSAGHVGKIGERMELLVTLVDVIAFEKWGRTRHRFRFRDDQGHCFIWWTDIEDAGIPPGIRAKARMTVKEHSRYRGTDETVVQNVRVHAVSPVHDA
jgi:hypothetical protein